MNLIPACIASFPAELIEYQFLSPWEFTQRLPAILEDLLPRLGPEYHLSGGIAVHRTAVVETGVVLKPPVIIGAGCFVGAHAYLRGGVFLGEGARVGPGCEIKTSVIGAGSAVAHFNFIGDSLTGSDVNIEAGAVTANHHNDRADKRIFVRFQGQLIDTQIEKFGALIGDRTKIGANAVLSPGTLLLPDSIVRRLELVDQETVNPPSA